MRTLLNLLVTMFTFARAGFGGTCKMCVVIRCFPVMYEVMSPGHYYQCLSLAWCLHGRGLAAHMLQLQSWMHGPRPWQVSPVRVVIHDQGSTLHSFYKIRVSLKCTGCGVLSVSYQNLLQIARMASKRPSSRLLGDPWTRASSASSDSAPGSRTGLKQHSCPAQLLD